MQRRMSVVVILAVLGVLNIVRSMGNPRVELLHGSDIVQMIASGLLLGVAFGLLVGRRQFRGEPVLS